MKYVKGNFKGNIDPAKDENTKHGKVRLTMPDGFSETPWVVERKDEPDHVVLVNHALIFMPFHSWGMIIPKGKSNMAEIRKSEVITLHPEAFDTYVEEGIIDTEGNPLGDDLHEKLDSYRSVE